MRLIFIFIFLFAMFGFSAGETPYQKQKQLQEEQVAKQRSEDMRRKAETLKRIRGFIADINGKLDRKGNGIILPVDEDDAIDIKDDDTIMGDIEHKGEYKYIAVRNAKLRNAANQVIDALDYGERVLALYTDKKLGVTFIRRSNKNAVANEGWVYSDILQGSKPNQSYIIPTEGAISSRFGSRNDPFSKKNTAFHKGVDIAAKRGTPVRAAADGVVVQSGFNKNGYGNLIVIDHGDGVSTYYAHLDSMSAAKENKVKQGDVIGTVGSTGRATGPHLHFEVRKGGSALDPEKFFPEE